MTVEQDQKRLQDALSSIEFSGYDLIKDPSKWDGRVQYGPSAIEMIARRMGNGLLLLFQQIEETGECAHRIPIESPSVSHIHQGNVTVSRVSTQTGTQMPLESYTDRDGIHALHPNTEKSIRLKVEQYRACITSMLICPSSGGNWHTLPGLSEEKKKELLSTFEFFHQIIPH